jgi:cytochrome P450
MIGGARGAAMVEYDPYMPEIKQDPLPVYKRMRQECPIYPVERFNAWALTRFEDIWTVCQDGEYFSSANGNSDLNLLEGRPSPLQTLASMDGEAHRRLRKALFPHFGPRAARRLSAPMREWARECLDAHLESGRIDAVRELSQQIAVRVSCAVSGLPVEDADTLLRLVHSFFAREEGTEGMAAEGREAVMGLWDYLEAASRDRRASGREGGDALDTLTQYRDEAGELLSDERIARHLLLLVVGATETFPKVFASALLRLWEYPDQRRVLCEEPALIPMALKEVLRFDTPTQWLGRTVIRDYELRGQKFRPGQPVLLIFPSANRDELEFDEPDRFDIQRDAERILTFGHGAHRCLGNHLAQMEGLVLLEEVLGRFPEYEVLTDALVRPATEFVQGYSEFPIALGAAG